MSTNRVLRLWRGEVPLFNAFWDWALIGGLIVNVSTTIACLILVMQDFPVAAVIAGYAISVPYNIFITVAVWRSAARYKGDPRWATAARVATVIGMTVLSLT
ncbi:MAG: hypothetical protein AB7P12_08525 [Alphaproteobacteria bacterium]